MRENLIKAVEFDPDNIEARIKLGRVYLLFNDLYLLHLSNTSDTDGSSLS